MKIDSMNGATTHNIIKIMASSKKRIVIGIPMDQHDILLE